MSPNLDRSTWTRVKFGDVIQNVSDRVDDPSQAGVERYVGLEHLDPGSMTIQRWGTPAQVEAQKLRFHPGDVIFGRRRAYQKKVARADFEGICSAHALVLRAKPGRIDPDFLPVFLSSDAFLDRAVQISVGSLSPTVNWKTLAVQEFDLPPLDEQKGIADLLWAVEGHRMSLMNLAGWVQTSRKALVDAAVSRAIETHGSRPLAEVASVRGGIQVGKKVAGALVTRPYLRVANVQAGFVVLDEIKSLEVSAEDAVRYRLEAGDVLMTEGGDLDKLGRGCVWRGQVPECLHQNHVFAVRCGDQVLPEWVSLHSEAQLGRDYFLRCAKRTTNLASINKSQVGALPVAVAPTAEQTEVIETIRGFDEGLAAIEAELRQLGSVRERLLAPGVAA